MSDEYVAGIALIVFIGLIVWGVIAFRNHLRDDRAATEASKVEAEAELLTTPRFVALITFIPSVGGLSIKKTFESKTKRHYGFDKPDSYYVRTSETIAHEWSESAISDGFYHANHYYPSSVIKSIEVLKESDVPREPQYLADSLRNNL